MPTTLQIILLIVAIGCFTASAAASLARLWWDRDSVRIAAKAFLYLGVCASLGVLLWHSIDRRQWLPIGDNFDALIWLALLLALFVLYLQRAHPLTALDWFILPIVVLLLIAAAVLGRVDYHPYVEETWSWVHRVTSYLGAAAFGIAFGSSALYVIVARRLRSKSPTGPMLGSLERLEKLTMAAVTIGFALLTVGLITGGVQMIAANKNTTSAKLVLSCAVWLVYAVVMHAPINPRLRGRRAAILSVFGFCLMIGTLLAVQLGGA